MMKIARIMLIKEDKKCHQLSQYKRGFKLHVSAAP